MAPSDLAYLPPVRTEILSGFSPRSRDESMGTRPASAFLRKYRWNVVPQDDSSASLRPPGSLDDRPVGRDAGLEITDAGGDLS